MIGDYDEPIDCNGPSFLGCPAEEAVFETIARRRREGLVDTDLYVEEITYGYLIKELGPRLLFTRDEANQHCIQFVGPAGPIRLHMTEPLRVACARAARECARVDAEMAAEEWRLP